MGSRGVRPKRRHRWDLTPREAIALQKRMRSRLILHGGPRAPRLVAGADVAYSKETGRCFAAVVVLSLSNLEVVEEATAEAPIRFPYVPGLLSFREGPAVLAAFAKLSHRPDFIIFDAHGFAHPRRFGLASHLGYLLDIPSVGCAKSILVGQHGALGLKAGSIAWLIDRGERIGAALRTQTGVRPVYISIGHCVSLRAAIRLARTATGKFRVPEPTRLADILVGKAKREAASPSRDAARYEARPASAGKGNRSALRLRSG
jgi:deoxyribonuclease V